MKYFLIFLTAIILFPMLPMTVHGATVAELQAQLTALLAQVAALQAQVAVSGASTFSGTVPDSLLSSHDLTVGSRGAVVMDLQIFLNANGAQIAASGSGSPGNETEYFGSLTKAALAKWQLDNGVSPARGYFGAKTREKLTVISRGVRAPAIMELPAVSTPVGAAPLSGATSSSPVTILATTTPATTTPEAVISLPNPFQSTLIFETILFQRTLSSYGDKILTEFGLKATEKIAITRIRFMNNGTFHNDKIINIRLLNPQTNEVLATVDAPVSGAIEFKMSPDLSKTDKGLMVSGKNYNVTAFLFTPIYGTEKPYIKLDIDSKSDISAFDYNDLTRVADISKTNTFPIGGHKIVAF